MSDLFSVGLAIIGGMMCGGVVVTLGLFVLMRQRQAPVPPPPAKSLTNFDNEPPTRLKRPDGLESMEFPPPPNSDEYHTVEQEALPTQFPWLEGIGGVVAGQRISIQDTELVVGRSRVCDIQFPDPKVSRQHAMIRLYRGNYFIQDMESSRGTLVNSQPIQTHLLKQGDQIRLGDTVLVFHRATDAAPPAE